MYSQIKMPPHWVIKLYCDIKLDEVKLFKYKWYHEYNEGFKLNFEKDFLNCMERLSAEGKEYLSKVYKEGRTLTDLARYHNVSIAHVDGVIRNARWYLRNNSGFFEDYKELNSEWLPRFLYNKNNPNSDWYKIAITEVGFNWSNRVRGALKRSEKYNWVGAVLGASDEELLEIWGIGKGALREIYAFRRYLSGSEVAEDLFSEDFDKKLEDVDFSPRVKNILLDAGYVTLKDIYLANKEDLATTPGLGKTFLREVMWFKEHLEKVKEGKAELRIVTVEKILFPREV